jgi:molecular chaperone HtpG
MAPTTNEKKKKMEEVSNGNYVHDDIVISILSKLPIKSMKRFSCVRKSWSLLLENPSFINMFVSDACIILNQSPYSNGFKFYFLSDYKFQKKLKKFSCQPPLINPLLDFDFIQILGSDCAVNDTVCIYGVKNHVRKAILWNPATNKVKVIPPSLVELLPPEAISDCQIYGFGYDHARDDYKLIQHVDVAEGGESFWEIYSLKTDSWRKLDFDMPAHPEIYARSDVYSNGVCHWLEIADDNDNFDIVVVSFHLSNEMCIVTPFPSLEDMNFTFNNVYLDVLNGSVALMINHDRSLHISVLGELGVKESWVRLVDTGPLT